MKVKPGANYDGLTGDMKRACEIIDRVYERYDYVCVLTSGKDGEHGEGSLHYEGRAGDFRNRQMPAENKGIVATDCRKELGNDFEVILEKTHMHVEHDPQHNRRVKT